MKNMPNWHLSFMSASSGDMRVHRGMSETRMYVSEVCDFVRILDTGGERSGQDQKVLIIKILVGSFLYNCILDMII